MAESEWADLVRNGGRRLSVRKASVVAFCPGFNNEDQTLIWISGIPEALVVDETMEDVARALGAA